jgi:hypothetical protein
MTDPHPRPAAGRAAAPRACDRIASGSQPASSSGQPARAGLPGGQRARLWSCESVRRYVASWAEITAPGGWGAASSWVPMTFEYAKATLIAELQRNLGRWAGAGGSDPARYDDALQVLRAATGPLTIGLPGHALSITETPGARR